MAAVGGLDCVRRLDFTYSKVDVMLLNLCQPGDTDDQFATSQLALATKMVAVLDQINDRWGGGKLRAASVSSQPDWAMRREMMS